MRMRRFSLLCRLSPYYPLPASCRLGAARTLSATSLADNAAQKHCRECRMKTSTDRILTTHTGSLPRPKSLIDLILRREKGEAVDAAVFEQATAKAVDEVVA